MNGDGVNINITDCNGGLCIIYLYNTHKNAHTYI